MIHQRADVFRHVGAIVLLNLVEFCGFAMAAIVERNHPAASLGKCIDPAGIDPVHFLGRTKAVHQHNRFAAAFSIKVGDLDRAMME